MKRLLSLGLLVFCCLAQSGVQVAGQQPATPAPPKPLPKGVMQQKLESCQKLLEALSLNDLPKAADCAQDLIILSQKAEWKVVATPRYKELSNEFRAAAEQVVNQSRAKNADGAALGYLDISMLCFKCHKHMREVRMASR